MGNRTDRPYLAGFYHYGIGLNDRNLRVVGKIGTNKHGFYKAEIYLGSARTAIKTNNSMFPGSWTEDRINKGYIRAVDKLNGATYGVVEIPLSSVEGLYYKGINLKYVFWGNRVKTV